MNVSDLSFRQVARLKKLLEKQPDKIVLGSASST